MRLRSKALCAVAALVPLVVGSSWSPVSATIPFGTIQHGIYSDITWQTWNSQNTGVSVAGIFLGPRSAYLESLKGAAGSYCVDSVFDWKTSSGHYDARLLRNCQSAAGAFQNFFLSELPYAGLGFTLNGENKHGLCYLWNPTANGKTGSNVAVAPSVIRQSGWCTGFSPQPEGLTQAQARYPANPVNPICADIKIVTDTLTFTLVSTDRRSCTA